MLVWGRVYVTIFNDVTHRFFLVVQFHHPLAGHCSGCGAANCLRYFRWCWWKENLGKTNLRKKWKPFLVGGWATHLKNMSQNGNLPQIGVKIKNIWNHHLVLETIFDYSFQVSTIGFLPRKKNVNRFGFLVVLSFNILACQNDLWEGKKNTPSPTINTWK